MNAIIILLKNYRKRKLASKLARLHDDSIYCLERANAAKRHAEFIFSLINTLKKKVKVGDVSPNKFLMRHQDYLDEAYSAEEEYSFYKKRYSIIQNKIANLKKQYESL